MVPLVLSPRRHAALTACLAQSVPATAGSRHFTLYRLEPAEHTAPEPELVVVHSFTQAQIDNNLGYFVVSELLPLLAAARGRTPRGTQPNDLFAYDEQMIFEHCVGAIVRSIDGNEQRAWHRFYANSLAALAQAMDAHTAASDFIGPFAIIYRELMSLIYGVTLLDAGTCFGFLPLLLARQGGCDPDAADRLLSEPLERIVGCDLDGALVGFASAYARQQELHNLSFVVADLLTEQLARLGVFDTVTTVHVLEHLDHDQTLRVLHHLWQVTARRLIVVVPLEEKPDPRFGHRQVFNEDRLLALGRELGGRCWYFELHGAWLVVDRD